jgi:hypothetical protein
MSSVPSSMVANATATSSFVLVGLEPTACGAGYLSLWTTISTAIANRLKLTFMVFFSHRLRVGSCA